MNFLSFNHFPNIKILPFLFLTALILMFFLHLKEQGKRTFFRRQGIEFTDQARLDFAQRLGMKGPMDEIELVLGYAFGDYRFMSKDLKEIHKKFNLNHLFTPSAFHFSCLLNFLRPLLNLFPVAQTALLYLLGTFFLLWSPLSECFSLRRICHLKMISEFLTNLHFKVSAPVLFFAVFLIDFIFGSFGKSPRSFIYSFLFYGTVLLLSKHKWYEVLLGIFLGQWFMTSLNGNSFYPFHTLMGFVLTALIGMILPIIFITFFSKINLLLRLSLKLTGLEILFLKKINSIPLGTEVYFPTISVLIIFIILIYWSNLFLVRQKFSHSFNYILNLWQQSIFKDRTIGDVAIFGSDSKDRSI